MRWEILLAVALLPTACLSAARERARRDATVGRAAADGVRIFVDDGLGVVRLEADRIALWCSAPLVSFELELEQAGRFRLEARNAMPDATLSAPTASSVGEIETVIVTQPAWELQLDAGSHRISIGPPDAEVDGPWRFALLSDVQDAIGDVQDLFRRMNREPGLRFLLGAGDLTEDGAASELRRYQRELESLDIPYYTTLGNHELGVSPPRFHDYFGRGSFRFAFKGVQFTLLDSGSATLDPLVYDWLDGWLSEGEGGVHVVAMHIPPIDPIGVRNGSFASRNEAAKLLRMLAAGGVDMTLYGHIHSYYEFHNAGIPARISGGGGAIPERFDGVGRHFVVIDVDPREGIQSTQPVQVD
jgi:hypothetical protein